MQIYDVRLSDLELQTTRFAALYVAIDDAGTLLIWVRRNEGEQAYPWGVAQRWDWSRDGLPVLEVLAGAARSAILDVAVTGESFATPNRNAKADILVAKGLGHTIATFRDAGAEWIAHRKLLGPFYETSHYRLNSQGLIATLIGVAIMRKPQGPGPLRPVAAGELLGTPKVARMSEHPAEMLAAVEAGLNAIVEALSPLGLSRPRALALTIEFAAGVLGQEL